MSFFSIVIPTYNSLATLPAAVESALAQDHGACTVVVSDNASTDGSAAYLRSLSHPRLRVILNESCLGKTANWNRAFAQASDCSYMVMLHSDDVLYPGALAALERSIRRHPDAVMHFGNHDTLSVDGCTPKVKSKWPLGYRIGYGAFNRLQTLTNAVSVVAVTFKTAAYQKVGGFDPRYAFYQDMELYDRLAALGDVVYIPVKLGQYRDTPLRPANRLAFACEEVDWVLDRGRGWGPLHGPLVDAWIADTATRMSHDLPELLAKFRDFLETRGRQSALSGGRFPRIKAHLFLKLIFSICHPAWHSRVAQHF